MSHELKRLVREAMRSTGPEPGTTERARSSVVKAVRRRYGRARRLRWGLALTLLILLASGLGFGLGQWLGPAQGTAAPRPATAVGFVPAKGWNVLQRGIGSRTAVASNVPLTSRKLPPHAIVITASLTPRRQRDYAPRRELPLSLAKAPVVAPPGERRLRASVGAYQLDVHVVFGTRTPSVAMVARAQKQIERLVVGAEAVTMFVRERLETPVRRVFTFSGSVASRAAGEYVEVLGRDCGSNRDRLIAGTQTVAGGGWEVESPGVSSWDGTPMPSAPIYSGTALRARWNNQFSEPYVHRTAIFINAMRAPGRRRAWLVWVNPSPVRVNLVGKVVELQRRSQGKWVPVRRARLVKSRTLGGFSSEAIFDVRTRGLTLRALIPSSSAAPCFLRAATGSWRS